MKSPSLRGRKAAPTGKVSAALFPQAQQLKIAKSSSEQGMIQSLTTTQLESFARYYERGSLGQQIRAQRNSKGHRYRVDRTRR